MAMLQDEQVLPPPVSPAVGEPRVRSGLADAVTPRGRRAAADVEMLDRARASLDKAVDHLLGLQHEDGHWCAELEGDSILQSEYILAIWIIGQERQPWFARRLPKIANYLRRQQRPDGSWGQYPGGQRGGGKFDLSATVKAYFALKLMGDDPEDEHMQKARGLILEHGGAERCNSFSKFYLACLGQVSYDAIPTIPPQVVFFPKWFYFHLDKVSAWSRTMIVPLSIVTACKVRRQLPGVYDIGELFTNERNRHRLLATGFGKSAFWTRAFLTVDKAMKIADRLRLMSLGREAALRRMEQWLIEHCRESDGPGAIFPPIVYLLIALIGGRRYGADDAIVRDNHRHLSNYMIYGEDGSPRNGAEYPLAEGEEHDFTKGPRAEHPVEPEDVETIRLQPCESPLWDTGIAAYALTDAGLGGEHEAMRRCADWLVAKECRKKADWAANVKGEVDFSGWFFEYHNPWYPDVDDTVMVSMALRRIAEGDVGRKSQITNYKSQTNPKSQIPNPKLLHDAALAASKRSLAWILAMQNDDGGWAAFDRTKDRPLYDCVPFADHNAIQDPSCADITGRTLECLGHHGFAVRDAAVRRAVAFLRNTQEPEGCWFGRWGVNYIYGTWQAICGLANVGQDMAEPWIQQAAQWLRSVQKPDGSFGESPDSYEDATLKGRGPSTASQTSWAAMTLLSICGPHDAAVVKAVRWLCDTQLESGTWDEKWFTGTGFPKVFYLRYHYYRLYFPIMCLGRWVRAAEVDT